MFEPDGRNSVQTLGHGFVSAARWVLIVFGILALFPIFTFLYTQDRLKAQEATLDALNGQPAAHALVVDFNQAEIGAFDWKIEEQWEKTGSTGMSPALRTLPFTVTEVAQKNGFDFEPVERPMAAWTYYNLPFDHYQLSDFGFNHAVARGLFPRIPDYSGIEGLVQKHGEDARADPWWLSSAFRLTKTKDWDWDSGLMMAHAKAAGNTRAYVTAARTVARMRYLLASLAAGDTPNVAGPVPPPALVASRSSNPDRFVQVYRVAFQGKLPVVFLQTQDFTGATLAKDEYLAEIIRRGNMDKDPTRDFSVGWDTKTPNGFITGLQLWPGYHQVRRITGRPVFTYSDFFLNSNPEPSPDSARAQAALMVLAQEDFWIPLFQAEGYGSPEALDLLHQMFTHHLEELGRDIAFCRMTAHKVYTSR